MTSPDKSSAEDSTWGRGGQRQATGIGANSRFWPDRQTLDNRYPNHVRIWKSHFSRHRVLFENRRNRPCGPFTINPRAPWKRLLAANQREALDSRHSRVGPDNPVYIPTSFYLARLACLAPGQQYKHRTRTQDDTVSSTDRRHRQPSTDIFIRRALPRMGWGG